MIMGRSEIYIYVDRWISAMKKHTQRDTHTRNCIVFAAVIFPNLLSAMSSAGVHSPWCYRLALNLPTHLISWRGRSDAKIDIRPP